MMRLFIFAPIYVIGVLLVGAMLRYNAADVEAYFFPVITNVTTTDVSRSDDRICWIYSFDKAREAKTEFMAWTLYADGKAFFVNPFNANTGAPIAAANATPKGAHRSTPFCLMIPEQARSAHKLQIVGQITYQVWHGLWSIDSNIPIFPP